MTRACRPTRTCIFQTKAIPPFLAGKGTGLGGGAGERKWGPERRAQRPNSQRHGPISGDSADDARKGRVVGAEATAMPPRACGIAVEISSHAENPGAGGASDATGRCKTLPSARHEPWSAVEVETADLWTRGITADIDRQAPNPTTRGEAAAPGLFRTSRETRQARRTGETEPTGLLTSGFAIGNWPPQATHAVRGATMAAGIITALREDCQGCAECSCAESGRVAALRGRRLVGANPNVTAAGGTAGDKSGGDKNRRTAGAEAGLDSARIQLGRKRVKSATGRWTGGSFTGSIHTGWATEPPSNGWTRANGTTAAGASLARCEAVSGLRATAAKPDTRGEGAGKGAGAGRIAGCGLDTGCAFRHGAPSS